MSQKKQPVIFVRGIIERTGLTLFGAGLAAFMGFMFFGMFEWKPHGLFEHLIHAVGLEAFFCFALLGLLCIVWGLFASDWVENLITRTFWKITAVFGVIAAVSLISVICYVLLR